MGPLTQGGVSPRERARAHTNLRMGASTRGGRGITSRKSCTSVKCPSAAAKCSAVVPSLFGAHISALASISWLAQCRCPPDAAQCKGRSPSLFFEFTCAFGCLDERGAREDRGCLYSTAAAAETIDVCELVGHAVRCCNARGRVVKILGRKERGETHGKGLFDEEFEDVVVSLYCGPVHRRVAVDVDLVRVSRKLCPHLPHAQCRMRQARKLERLEGKEEAAAESEARKHKQHSCDQSEFMVHFLLDETRLPSSRKETRVLPGQPEKLHWSCARRG